MAEYYKVQKNIPIPGGIRGSRGELSALLMGLEIGDCFEFPIQRWGAVTTAAAALKKSEGRAFTSRRNHGGASGTVWRIPLVPALLKR